MAAHQLGGTFGKRNPRTLRWFCRCPITEDTRYRGRAGRRDRIDEMAGG
jgi:hypothetical protein